MIEKLLALGFATVLLAASMAATPAHAGCSPLVKGKKGCANEVKGCGRKFGSVNKGKAKLKVKKACRTQTVSQCRANATVCSASPSGAFVD